MASVDLKRLRREDLLQLLLERTREVEELRAQLAQKNADEAAAAQELVVMETVPAPELSAQEAASIQQVCTDAQSAIQTFLAELAHMKEAQEKRCEELEANARARADRLLSETRSRCDAMEKEARERCQAMSGSAGEENRQNWETVLERLEKLGEGNKELRKLVSGKKKGKKKK